MYTEELPPHDDEAEEAVLGSLLISNDEIPHVSLTLGVDDFFRQKHGWVYGAILELYQRGDAVNQISTADELNRTGRLEDMGGLGFLSHLIATVPTSVYASNYAKVVKGKSLQRQLIKFGANVAEIGFKGEEEPDGMLRRVEAGLAAISARPSRGPEPISAPLERFLEDSPRDGRKSGVQTGIADLDNMTGGFIGGQVVVLAAATSAGKSALAKDISMNVAAAGKRVAFFSVEMSETENVARILARESSVGLSRVLKGPWSEQEEAKIMRSAGAVAEYPLHLKSSGDLTIQSLRSQARMVRQEHGLDLIVVDYLQLIKAVDTRQNRVAQVTEVTHGLKALAMDLNVPLLALAQLNREFEKRPSKAPILSDLRESGSIEQDADVVLLLYRPELYYTEEEWMRTSEEPYPRGMAQVNVAKQRNGPLGVFDLIFREETATFRSLARPETQLEGVLR